MFNDSHLRLAYIENKMTMKQAKHQRMFPELDDRTPEYLTHFSSQTIKLYVCACHVPLKESPS